MSEGLIFKPFPHEESYRAGRESALETPAFSEGSQAEFLRQNAINCFDRIRQMNIFIRKELNDVADMITVEEAARRLSLSPQEYRDLAYRGEALLFKVDPDLERVPAWSLMADGKIDSLIVDYAREYARSPAQRGLTFESFISFIRETSVDITDTIDASALSQAAQNLCTSFKVASKFSVSVSLTELLAGRGKSQVYFQKLMTALDQELINYGGDFGADGPNTMSQEFMQKYGLRRDDRDRLVFAPR